MLCMPKHEVVGSVLCKSNKFVTNNVLIIKCKGRNLVSIFMLAIFDRLIWNFEKAL